MSRGIGRLQRRVLEALEAAGRWQWVADIVRCIHGRVETDVERRPPRSLAVAVRRAVYGLTRRGLVRSGRVQPRYIGMESRRFACWLPGHQAPDARAEPQIPGDVIEE